MVGKNAENANMKCTQEPVLDVTGRVKIYSLVLFTLARTCNVFTRNKALDLLNQLHSVGIEMYFKWLVHMRRR